LFGSFLRRLGLFNDEYDPSIQDNLVTSDKLRGQIEFEKYSTEPLRIEENQVITEKFDPSSFFLSYRRKLDLGSHGVSNVGRLTLTLFFLLSIISLAIVTINDHQQIPTVNHPDIENFIDARFQAITSFFGTSYDSLKKPFDGKQHLLHEEENVFVCPQGKSGIQTIGSCFFYYADYTIHNVLEAIPSYGTHIFNVFSNLINQFAPQHFHVEDAWNSFRLLVQKIVPLTPPATRKPEITYSIKNETTAASRTGASFSFDPFPEDVVRVKETCISQCDAQTQAATDFIFKTVFTITGVATPMTKRDYIFNELMETSFYICQYTAEDNFGGSWVYFIESCLCGASCSNTPLYFGEFNGCADLLHRIGISCTGNNPCTLDRLCPYEDRKLVLTASDTSDVLYTFLDDVCLDICSDLAGFTTFEALLALSAAGSSLGGNVLGLSGNAFGGPLGVPASLLPGKY